MIIPIAFLTGVAIGVLIGSIMGYECGTANGVREGAGTGGAVEAHEDIEESRNTETT